MQIDLDPDHLRALRAAWQSDDSLRLTAAVRDLFDGQDGELRIVNEALAQARPSQLREDDLILQRFGDWAIVQSPSGDRWVSHIGHPVGWSAIDYDIDFERLGENWERQLDEKSWMTRSSKYQLGLALARAREMAAG